MSAPDLTKKVLGFRQFSVQDGGFCSVGINTLHWLPGVNRARCLARFLHYQRPWFSAHSSSYEPPPPPPRHAAPAPGCNCGLYGLHEFSPDWLDGFQAQSSPEAIPVVGVILGWGRMEVHKQGFRAEYAELMLVGYDPLIGLRQIARVEEAARAYGVRAVSLEDLEREASQFGERLPERLLPAPAPAEATPRPSSPGDAVVKRQQELQSQMLASIGARPGPKSVWRRTRGTKLRAAINLPCAAFNLTWFFIHGALISLILAPVSLAIAAAIWWPWAIYTNGAEVRT